MLTLLYVSLLFLPLSQSNLELELVECRGHISQLEKDLASKEDELKELLKAIECMQTTKVKSMLTSSSYRHCILYVG